jgi:hypothetical protein
VRPYHQDYQFLDIHLLALFLVLVLFFIASVSVTLLASTTTKEGEEAIGQRWVLTAHSMPQSHIHKTTPRMTRGVVVGYWNEQRGVARRSLIFLLSIVSVSFFIMVAVGAASFWRVRCWL